MPNRWNDDAICVIVENRALQNKDQQEARRERQDKQADNKVRKTKGFWRPLMTKGQKRGGKARKREVRGFEGNVGEGKGAAPKINKEKSSASEIQCEQKTTKSK